MSIKNNIRLVHVQNVTITIVWNMSKRCFRRDYNSIQINIYANMIYFLKKMQAITLAMIIPLKLVEIENFG